MGWSDQERHGSGEAEVKDWLPIKIPHCTLSIVLYPGSAACSSVESGIEPRMLGYNSESAKPCLFSFFFSTGFALSMGNEFRCIGRFRLEIEAFSCLLASIGMA